MTASLFPMLLSNLLISALLGMAAYAVGRTGRFPRATHFLWLLVLLKLVTPSFVALPVLPAASEAAAPAVIESPVAGGIAARSEPLWAPDAVATATSGVSWSTLLLCAWAIGSLVVLIWSLIRILRFDRLLRAGARPAPSDVQRWGRGIARRLGLRRVPHIHTTDAQLSPLVWWIGGRVRVVLPFALTREMEPRKLQWVLAHELAHVKRGDHLVRWLEWTVCVLFWWNPVAWWARRSLRTHEEICCDALVLHVFTPNPRTYAHSLLGVVEFLSGPPSLPPPVLASGMSSGGAQSLERRFKMIVSRTALAPLPRWLRAATLLCVFALLPLGLARAEGDGDSKAQPKKSKSAEEKFEAFEQKIRDKVARGELTEAEGAAKLAAYRNYLAGNRGKGKAAKAHGKAAKAAKSKQEKILKFREKLDAAVDSGALTEEEAAAKMQHFVERLESGPGKKTEAQQAFERAAKEVRQDLADAVKAGDITEAEAKERYLAWKQHARAKQQAEGRPTEKQMAQVQEKLAKAVAKGELTEEEAKARYAQWLEWARGGGKAKHKGDKAKEPKPKRDNLEKLKRKLEDAVARGDLTEAEAVAKWERILKRQGQGAGK